MPDFVRERLYLDHNATTAPRPSALNGAREALRHWGNPSSVHRHGARPKALIWSARQNLSRFLNCRPLEIVFNSGATESNNQALKGLFENPNKRRELIISAVEHPSLSAPADFLAQRGFKTHKIPVSREGVLDEAFFEKALSEKSLLVSVMSANNETGNLFPIKRLAEKAHQAGALFHSDMAQALGKIPVNLSKENVDLASGSAHKFYGLKGCGFLYCKRGTEIPAFIQGGPQERQRRAGTENLPGIAALGAVAKEGREILRQSQNLKPLRDDMEEDILSSLPGVKVAGAGGRRLFNTSCLLISGVEGETLLMNLDLKGISVSVGSACGAGKIETGSVLKAMGYTEQEARGALRVSLGLGVTKEGMAYFQKSLKECVTRLRKLA